MDRPFIDGVTQLPWLEDVAPTSRALGSVDVPDGEVREKH
jgi:hypothetical protein